MVKMETVLSAFSYNLLNILFPEWVIHKCFVKIYKKTITGKGRGTT